jgi:hypothetical protein
MATYSATNYNKTGVSAHGFAGNVKAKHWTVACAASPATTDTINFGYLPANARVLLAVLESTDMDTNGTPLLALNVGDASSAARLFSASTVGQAGTLSSAIAVAGAGYKYTAKTLITGTASANAATGAAGTLYLTVFYIVD